MEVLLMKKVLPEIKILDKPAPQVTKNGINIVHLAGMPGAVLIDS